MKEIYCFSGEKKKQKTDIQKRMTQDKDDYILSG